MREVLISTQPKWVEKEVRGEKRIEVRKSRPELETPFKVYIYCTKDGLVIYGNGKQYVTDSLECLKGSAVEAFENSSGFRKWNGKVIGEFVCDKIDEYTAEFVNDGDCYEDIRRHWIDDDGEEDFEIITSNGRDNPEDCELLKNSCLSYAELKKYIGENFHDIPFYGWHISDLKIYDKPKELSEFKKAGFMTEEEWLAGLYPNTHCHYEAWAKRFEIKRPPQSWCYVAPLNT